MEHVFIICDLDPEHMLKLKAMESKSKYRFYFPSSTNIPSTSGNAKLEAKLMIEVNKDLMTISNYGKFLNFLWRNEDKRVSLVNKAFEKYSSSNEISTDKLIDLKNKLSDDSLDPLTYAKIAFELSMVYLYLYNNTTGLTTGEKEDEMIESVSEKYDEEELVVTNELEMLNAVLRESFTKEEISNMNILKASYNSKEMETEEIFGILSTHILPQYMTQIDIRDTKDDTYTIETDLCTIVRESGTMEFHVYPKGDK